MWSINSRTRFFGALRLRVFGGLVGAFQSVRVGTWSTSWTLLNSFFPVFFGYYKMTKKTGRRTSPHYLLRLWWSLITIEAIPLGIWAHSVSYSRKVLVTSENMHIGLVVHTEHNNLEVCHASLESPESRWSLIRRPTTSRLTSTAKTVVFLSHSHCCCTNPVVGNLTRPTWCSALLSRILRVPFWSWSTSKPQLWHTNCLAALFLKASSIQRHCVHVIDFWGSAVLCFRHWPNWNVTIDWVALLSS